jgi:putative addiction module component (TIGR02574 family)
MSLPQRRPAVSFTKMTSDDLKAAALALPRDKRAQLAEDLLRSLDRDPLADDVWTREVARRAREVADGTVQPVDWDVARERIARRLEDRRREAAASSRR